MIKANVSTTTETVINRINTGKMAGNVYEVLQRKNIYFLTYVSAGSKRFSYFGSVFCWSSSTTPFLGVNATAAWHV